jgi:hypothetical protein
MQKYKFQEFSNPSMNFINNSVEGLKKDPVPDPLSKYTITAIPPENVTIIPVSGGMYLPQRFYTKGKSLPGLSAQILPPILPISNPMFR